MLSGFTFIKNAQLYDFPVIESIQSLLPLVDEMIILLGDSDDNTTELIQSIKNEKIKIFHSVWDQKKYSEGGSIYAQQTNLAKRYCTGDWCIYIQGDEVLHEDAIPIIKGALSKYNDDSKVEGFTLKYHHFYGSYNRYIDNQHFAYPNEIRIIRNNPDIHSWKDAQSFRRIPDFNGLDFYQKEGTFKLKVINLNAFMYHYGHCRNPKKMGKKKKEQEESHYGTQNSQYSDEVFDYGNLSYLPIFKGEHPNVMLDRIEMQQKTWEKTNRYTGPKPKHLPKVFQPKYQIISFIENKILGGRGLGVFKNYISLGKFP